MTVAALPVTALDFGNAVRAYKQQLLDAIIDQAGRLSRISLEPRCVEPIEHEAAKSSCPCGRAQ